MDSDDIIVSAIDLSPEVSALSVPVHPIVDSDDVTVRVNKLTAHEIIHLLLEIAVQYLHVRVGHTNEDIENSLCRGKLSLI